MNTLENFKGSTFGGDCAPMVSITENKLKEDTMRICRCGEENRDGANFCGACGAKLVEVCNCWVKKEPYNCGQVECPGYRLFLLEKRAAQSQADLVLDDLATKVDKG